jgi:SH3 domain-containing protein
MKRGYLRRNRARIIWASLIVSGMLAATTLAETVWIKSDNVQIRSGKGAVYPIIASATKGAQLTVVSHDGKWLVVQVGDQQGYVFQNAVSTDPVGGDGNVLAGLGAGANASSLSSGAAGKGLSGDAENYSASKHIDTGPMNRLIDFRKHFDPKLWEAFTAEGKVGPDAPNAQ